MIRQRRKKKLEEIKPKCNPIIQSDKRTCEGVLNVNGVNVNARTNKKITLGQRFSSSLCLLFLSSNERKHTKWITKYWNDLDSMCRFFLQFSFVFFSEFSRSVRSLRAYDSVSIIFSFFSVIIFFIWSWYFMLSRFCHRSLWFHVCLHRHLTSPKTSIDQIFVEMSKYI